LPEQYEKYLDRLKPGILYHNAGYSQLPPRPYWGKLDYLKSIKNFIFGAYIWNHDEYGWSIFPDWKKNYAYLPAPRKSCKIVFDNVNYNFEVVKIKYRRPTIMEVVNGETKLKGWRRGTERILHCPGSLKALFEWANKYFKVEEICKVHNESVAFSGGGISIFVEVIEPRKSYLLRPAFHFYPRHMRDKSMLDERIEKIEKERGLSALSLDFNTLD